MRNKKIGFIGCGNMGSAILKGLIDQQLIDPSNTTLFVRNTEKRLSLSKLYACHQANSVEQLTKQSDIIILTVKPNAVTAVLKQLHSKSAISQEAILISIVAGITLQTLESIIGENHKIVRVMPNTPALIQAGMSAITPNKQMTQEETLEILQLFQGLGRAEIIDEHLMDAVVGISGSAPAYIFMLIEAMADAAVLAGMPREQAYLFAAQTVKGSAQMVLNTEYHPAQLKDMVCSPAGTTIEAVKVLEQKGFRSAIIDAIDACVEKSKQLSQEY